VNTHYSLLSILVDRIDRTVTQSDKMNVCIIEYV